MSLISLALITSFLLEAVVYILYVIAVSGIVWMAVDAAKQDKILWLLFILGVPGIGALAYFFVEKQKDYAKMEESAKTQ